jgi:hypothetical protein
MERRGKWSRPRTWSWLATGKGYRASATKIGPGHGRFVDLAGRPGGRLESEKPLVFTEGWTTGRLKTPEKATPLLLKRTLLPSTKTTGYGRLRKPAEAFKNVLPQAPHHFATMILPIPPDRSRPNLTYPDQNSDHLHTSRCPVFPLPGPAR